MLKIIVLVSGGGSNLQAIIDGIYERRVQNTEIVAVISSKAQAYALTRAEKYGIPTVVVDPNQYSDVSLFNDALFHQIEAYKPDLIVLAGFLRKIPIRVIETYKNQIINVHPSLLPAFGGPGFYGLKVHEAALARGVKVSGATVHYVDEDLDTGPILMQKVVPVLEGDTPELLQRRVMEEAEWVILPEVINRIAMSKI